MTGYVIKSISGDGVYYLIKNWNKNKTFQKKKDWLKDGDFYKSAKYAIRSLKHLLEIMPDYAADKFSIVRIDVTDFWNGTWNFIECGDIKVIPCGTEWEPKFEIVTE